MVQDNQVYCDLYQYLDETGTVCLQEKCKDYFYLKLDGKCH